MCAAHRRGVAELVSRRGNDFADRFPEIAEELLELPDVVFDAELVILDAEGRRQFERLVSRSRRTRWISIQHGARMDAAVLFVFDIFELAGEGIRAKPLLDRRTLVDATLPDLKGVRFCGHVDEGGTMLFKVADGFGLEGIVAKRAEARYPSGGRSAD